MTVSLRQIDSLVVDLDGVLWRGPQMLPGVKAFFDQVQDNGLKLLLASNNSTARPDAIRQRLERVDVQVPNQAILTSAIATAGYLKRTLPPGAKILMIGEDGLEHALIQAEFTLVDQADDAQAVVVGMDRAATYDKLAEATLAIRSGAAFVGTNPDRTFPTPRGLVPGNGSLLAAIEAATDTAPTVVGKPETLYFELALETLGSRPGSTMMVGDRLDTDIEGGQRAGLKTGLVLTGVTDQSGLDASQIKPTWVFPDLASLTAALVRAVHD
jgi:4-nitrophenyl phosphatase